ncbi:hypothetical protein A8E81_10645 [Burkholderia cenocepacia]|nr:hypothetical protein A8E75_30550 [Burkholderia cenocepacia]ONV25277.1 hypothetical protein A8E74_09630 [Burkholderia cenocepacia]ONV30599.1 hypothetical protein A8E78_17495 [Burkholderia cenocepacia]ONV33440.1 hypothetical protein A8E77_15795 [Burkholderia cenocepacia]ONV40549.1 hypothetical protein A8E82_19510 [Burkholderia cenocepacia]
MLLCFLKLGKQAIFIGLRTRASINIIAGTHLRLILQYHFFSRQAFLNNLLRGLASQSTILHCNFTESTLRNSPVRKCHSQIVIDLLQQLGLFSEFLVDTSIISKRATSSSQITTSMIKLLMIAVQLKIK